MLPEILHPSFPFKLPVAGTKVNMRPMTVAEEKILLFVDTQDKQQVFDNLCKILQACLETKLDVRSICTADFEYLTLMLRSISTNNVVPVTLTVGEKEYAVKINIGDFKLRNTPVAPKIVDVNDTIKIKLKQPTAILDLTESGVELLRGMIDIVTKGEEAYKFSDYSDKEQLAFVESLPTKTSLAISEYYTNRPQLYYEVKCGKSTVEVTGLPSFF